MDEIEVQSVEVEEVEDNTPKCPVCGSDSMIIAGHCATCMSCGYSLCSL